FRVFLSFLAASALLSADTLVLRNGSRVEGSFVGANSHSVRFAVGDQVSSYSIDDIESIQFNNGPVPVSPPPAPPRAPARAPAPEPPRPPAPPVRNTSANLQLPAGSQIVTRLIDSVNSERDSPGRTYRASVDEPVVVNGETVIPRGADATATLIDLQQSGKIEGRTVLTLELRTITVEGKTYIVVSEGVPEASKSRTARSAKVIGGAAALGAIIGAAAGGGKGAAIGAGSGAAAGTAAEVLTSGEKVKIPAETR